MSDEEMLQEIEKALGDTHVKCLRAIVSAGAEGYTCDEVEVITGLPHQGASARIRELVQKKLIEERGIRRKTRSGRSAAVYIFKRP